MTQDPIKKLHSILSPSLLTKIYTELNPPPNAPAEEVFTRYYGSKPGLYADAYNLTFDCAIQPLSEIPLSDYPDDLLQLLPPPSDQTFPAQALALILLLDQVPRLIFRAHDKRWINAFFDVLALRLATQLHALSENERPTNIQVWTSRDYSWPAAALRAKLVGLPFIHAESATDAALARRLAESSRCAAEQHFGIQDPARSDPRANVDDLEALPRIVMAPMPPPYYELNSFADFLFFDALIDRAHAAPLERFRRYPWRNGQAGRVSSPEEENILARIPKEFSNIDPQVERDIREDVEKGVWRELKGGCP